MKEITREFFESFLRGSGLYEKVMRRYSEFGVPRGVRKRWVFETEDPEDWLVSLFCFDETEEGADYWWFVNDEWQKCIWEKRKSS